MRHSSTVPVGSLPSLDSPSKFEFRRAQSGSTRRIEAMLKSGSSALNRGLGGFRVSMEPDPPQEVEESGHSSRIVLIVAAAAVTVSSTLAIEVHYGRLSAESLITQDSSKWTDGMASLASIPLTCAAVNFLIQHVRRTTFFWDTSRDNTEEGRSQRRFIDPLAYVPMAFVALGLMRTACLKLIAHRSSARLAFYLEVALYLMTLSLYFSLLDYMDAGIKAMASEQELLNKTKPVKKMQNLVKNITRTGRPDKDCVYSFSQTNTVPAEVLSYVWWLYYIFGKIFGTIVVMLILMGWDGSVSKGLIGGLVLSIGTASSLLFELGPNTLSLFRLSLHKPFYVGDLVTLNLNGSMNSPQNSVMGFVENITMMYVVIRNFEMKQTWIPHKTFNSMIIQNWTRRPSKTVLLNIGISCRCPVEKVKQLTAFGMQWIQSSPEIQQQNYRKCHITKTGNGFNIEVIFYPEIGVSHRGIRQKFLVAFMSAAERMRIPFVPLQITANFCDNNATAPKGAVEIPQDAIFDDLLPDPNDLLPKGVGLGFKEFPVNRFPDSQQPNVELRSVPDLPVAAIV